MLFRNHYMKLVTTLLFVLPANAGHHSPPPALQNLGNTCYLNAQLQCAYHIPQVRQIVMHTSHNTIPTPLQELFHDMHNYKTASPRAFCQALGIPVHEQQDAQEFWKLLLPELPPVLTDLYQGAYQDYIIVSTACEKRRETAFLDISLDVNKTLQDALAQWVQPEQLKVAEGNGWRPQRDKPAVDAVKGIQLQSHSLPSILQLHLKRFHFDWTTEKTTKINAPCVFPVVLNMAQFCGDNGDGDSDEAVLYDLQGVVVHMGDSGGGHYYAYVRPDVQTDVWYRCNDHVIEQVDLKQVLCDSYGGQHRVDTILQQQQQQQQQQDDSSDTKKVVTPGFWRRFTNTFLMKKHTPSYGYGGPTSSAYVLQYVRRSDVPTLYRSVEEEDLSKKEE